jgi:hypothetical protein
MIFNFDLERKDLCLTSKISIFREELCFIRLDLCFPERIVFSGKNCVFRKELCFPVRIVFIHLDLCFPERIVFSG